MLTQNNPSPFVDVFTASDDAAPATQIVDLDFVFTVGGGNEGADCGTSPSECVSLNIVPTPSNITVADLPLLVPISSGNAVFQQLSFEDQNYTAFATVADSAGNTATTAHNFDVQRIVPSIVRTVPAQPGTLTAPGNIIFGYSVKGIRPGTAVHLCSTLPRPGDPMPVACRWGSDGTLGGPDAGFVVATVNNTGTVDMSGATFLSVPLEQGTQITHGEAREPDLFPDIFSDFATFTVDTIPPTINTLVLSQNDLGNDDTTLVLGDGVIMEGTVGVGTITTNVDVTLSEADAMETLTILSNNPSPNTPVGSVVLASDSSATVSVTLVNGLHTLTARVPDSNGNINMTSPSQTVRVDVTPPSGTVPSPLFSVYRGIATHGVLNTNGTPANLADDSLQVSLQVNISDNQVLTGSSITLRRFSVSVGGSADAQATVGGPTDTTSGAVTFANFPLVAGLNFLELEVQDSAGNSFTSPTRVQYNADLYGPQIALTVTNAAGVPQICGASAADPCPVALTQVGNRMEIDTTGSNIAFSLAGCANS